MSDDHEGALDSVDVELLAALQADARIPQASLGARVGLSAAAVNRRLRRLTDDGFITSIRARLSAERLGHPLTVIAQVEVMSEETERLDALEQAFVACRQVQQCYYVTGEWDFVLTIVVRDMEQYRELTRSLFFGSGNVKRFKTLVVMNASKVSLDVPLDRRN
ncbi:MAG TPA: Lrp/AsnC family transcriptional regulator [Phycicoccus sp.]|jgi:DNA-binding Lrp family transcriptional regulator|nr:Lrp/AsnC family transcriptional regulator [Phycicoccus sp.]HQH08996.1 Lrp/AsnC family transcriptional regulator [Phycicoccus sp.]